MPDLARRSRWPLPPVGTGSTAPRKWRKRATTAAKLADLTAHAEQSGWSGKMPLYPNEMVPLQIDRAATPSQCVFGFPTAKLVGEAVA